MTYFLLAIMLLLCTITTTTPQPVGATATLTVSGPPPGPGATYANAWAAAGPNPATLAQPSCGPSGIGIKDTTGKLVECPTGASTGTLKSVTHPSGDRATAAAWAKISGGVGTASAPVNIPVKPQVFAGAAAYAKANAPVPSVRAGAQKVGGNVTITYGNLTLNGWSEPVDHLTLIVVDNLSPGQLPDILNKILDEESITSLTRAGFEIAQPTKVYFSVQMLLPGIPGAKVQMGKPVLYKKMGKCPDNNPNQQGLEPCLISEKSPSEQDFTSCTAVGCKRHELKHTLNGMYETQIYLPAKDLPEETYSVHEITCVKSRPPDQPLPKKSDDICNLLIHVPQERRSS